MEKQTELEQKKALYTEGNHVCYYMDNHIPNVWHKWIYNNESIFKEKTVTIRLVKKGIHSDIAKAVAEDSSVEVEQYSKLHATDGTSEVLDFILRGRDFFKYYDDRFTYKLKQPKQDTISISDGDKAEHFAKFGFEVPEFECELLKAKDSGDVLGIIQEETHEEIATWSKTNGSCVIHSTLVKPYTDYRYNLTPLKPKQLTLNEILQDIQDKQMSVHAGELLIKAMFSLDSEV